MTAELMYYDGSTDKIKFTEISVQLFSNGETDECEMTCPQNIIKQAGEIKIFLNDRLIFSGVVVKQSYIFGVKRGTVISTRSRLYLAKTSEAMPQCHVKPSLTEIFNNHMKIHGITDFKGKRERFNWTYIVHKGKSDYDVLADFCLYCMDSVPLLTADGILDCTGNKSDEKLILDGSIKICEINYTESTDKRVREILIQSERGQGYNNSIIDKSAVEKLVSRRLFQTCEQWQAKRIIEESVRDSRTVSLKIVGLADTKINSRVKTDIEPLKQGNYSVSAIKYDIKNGRAYTFITLKRE